MNEVEMKARLYEIADELEVLGITQKTIARLRKWITEKWVYKPQNI